MRRSPACVLAMLLAASALACGKRADPLAPYLKNPQPPANLEVSQIGNEVEIRVVAPRTTTQNRPLPVIELEWLEAPASGDFGKLAKPLFREEVAPGELRVKRFPRPAADARFSVRAWSGKAKSTLASVAAYKLAPVPETPTQLQATNTPTGVELSWTNPRGAEPWPLPTPPATPTPPALPQPSPGPASASASGETAGKASSPSGTSPSGTVTPGGGAAPSPPSSPTPPEAAPASPPHVAGPPGSTEPPKATPVPTPTPRPVLTLPSGIRILRTDGTPRPAREPLQARSWFDTSVKTGDRPCYTVSYAASLKPLIESAPSAPVCVEVKDVIAPEPASELVADLGATFVELSWRASPSADVATYRIYRWRAGEERRVVLEAEGPILRTRDLDMTPGPRFYEVTAVDRSGNESAPTAPTRVVVPEP